MKRDVGIGWALYRLRAQHGRTCLPDVLEAALRCVPCGRLRPACGLTGTSPKVLPDAACVTQASAPACSERAPSASATRPKRVGDARPAQACPSPIALPAGKLSMVVCMTRAPVPA